MVHYKVKFIKLSLKPLSKRIFYFTKKYWTIVMQKTVSVQLLQKEERKKNCCVATRCDASKRFVESNRNVISHARIQFSLSLPCLSLFLSLSLSHIHNRAKTHFFLSFTITHSHFSRLSYSRTPTHTHTLSLSLSISLYFYDLVM